MRQLIAENRASRYTSLMSKVRLQREDAVRKFLPALILLAACGNPTGPYEQFVVWAESFTSNVSGTTISVQGQVRVTDRAGSPIRGASIRFRAAQGVVSPTQTTTRSGGLADVSWVIQNTQGLVDLETCASNSTRTCEIWGPIYSVRGP